MRTTIDSAGRVVIPKALRREAGLDGGGEGEVVYRDGRIEIEPATPEMRVLRQPGGATIAADAEMPILTADDVREVLEHARR